MTNTPFIPIEGQSFATHFDWVRTAKHVLTSHEDFNDTAHGDSKGWRGNHFTALCFDQKGRRCKNGGDFQRAEDEGTFPVYWIWPDQIVELIQLRASVELPADELPANSGFTEINSLVSGREWISDCQQFLICEYEDDPRRVDRFTRFQIGGRPKGFKTLKEALILDD